MAIDCLVRVSFQSEAEANQAVNEALVGDRQAQVGPGPFQRVNTAVYRAVAGIDADVIQSLNAFVAQLNAHADVVDFIGISLTRRRSVFNIEFEKQFFEELMTDLVDVAKLEYRVAQAAEMAKDKPGQTFAVSAGPFALHCEQRESGKGRSYFVMRAMK